MYINLWYTICNCLDTQLSSFVDYLATLLASRRYSMTGRVDDLFRKICKEAVVTECLHVHGRTEEIHGSCFGQDWNRVPPEYKSRALPLG
jgi:hypothetical protein